MAHSSAFKRGYLRAARIEASTAKTIREVLEARLSDLLPDGFARTIAATSGAGSSVSFATGQGASTNEDLVELLNQLLEVLTTHEVADQTQDALLALMLADDRLNGAKAFHPDFSNYGA